MSKHQQRARTPVYFDCSGERRTANEHEHEDEDEEDCVRTPNPNPRRGFTTEAQRAQRAENDLGLGVRVLARAVGRHPQ